MHVQVLMARFHEHDLHCKAHPHARMPHEIQLQTDRLPASTFVLIKSLQKHGVRVCTTEYILHPSVRA